MAALVLLGACIGSSPSGQEIRGIGPRAQSDPQTAGPAADAINQFGTDLMRATAAGRPNLVVSPYAVALTLAMVRAGASGETRNQLDRLLHASGAGDLDAGINTLAQELDGRSGDKRSDRSKGRVDLRVAAAIWGQRGTRYGDPYLNVLNVQFGKGVRVVDFRSDPEASRQAINTWARDDTGGNIDQLIPRGEVTQYTRYLAAATGFLRAPWQTPFDTTRTRPSAFRLPDGSTVEVPTMQISTRSGLRYGSGKDWEAVELPYLGDELGLVVVLPGAGRFDAVAAWLDGAAIEQIETSLDERAVDLRMPMFSFTTEVNLVDPLTAAGAPAVFSPGDAELPGVTTDDALAVSAFAYQGFFGVNEEGTEAPPGGATVTAAPDEPTAATRRVMVDRPFLFFVRDRRTGVAVLLGQVSRPR